MATVALESAPTHHPLRGFSTDLLRISQIARMGARVRERVDTQRTGRDEYPPISPTCLVSVRRWRRSEAHRGGAANRKHTAAAPPTPLPRGPRDGSGRCPAQKRTTAQRRRAEAHNRNAWRGASHRHSRVPTIRRPSFARPCGARGATPRRRDAARPTPRSLSALGGGRDRSGPPRHLFEAAGRRVGPLNRSRLLAGQKGPFGGCQRRPARVSLLSEVLMSQGLS